MVPRAKAVWLRQFWVNSAARRATHHMVTPLVFVFFQANLTEGLKSTEMLQKLVVFGGNGFLGKRIVQAGVEAGLQVTSLSRSGKAPSAAAISDAHWIREVQWQSADVFDPSTYRKTLAEADACVHSIGIILENPEYKEQLSKSPLNFFLGSSPMKKDPLFTYEKMNHLSAITLAKTFAQVAADKPFVYVSADKGPLGIPAGYINTKRQTERDLAEMGIPHIILRPGFMYDAASTEKNVRNGVRDALDVLNAANHVLLGKRCDSVNQMVRPSVSTQQVGHETIRRLQNQFRGVVYLEDF